MTYTGYARVAVARGSSTWSVSGNTVSSVSQENWPIGTGGSGTATFFSVGLAPTGAGQILYCGPYSPTVNTGSSVQPFLATASVISEA